MPKKNECRPAIERFEEKFIVTPGCWQWKASKTPGGYGFFNVSRTIKKTAHRYSYEVYVGEIPDGLFLLHICDNRSCVNPDHLRPGTHQENMADMKAKGRTAMTARMNSKLNQRLANEIRDLMALAPMTAKEIASAYGIHKSITYQIASGKSWKEV